MVNNQNMLPEIDQKKKLIRKKVKELKSTFNESLAQEASEKIFNMVEMLPEFINATTVLAYWSLPDEVNTHSFIEKWYQEKRILLPLVVGAELELRVYSGKNCMEKGPSFGILEPRKGEISNINEVDFAIIPGVAFDRAGNRLGRGKGYYDKLLKKHDLYKVGVCYNFQLLEDIPVDRNDIPVDKVIYA